MRWNLARHWYSDSTLNSIGGLLFELGVWWRCDLRFAEERKRSLQGVIYEKEGTISINLLELLAMVVTA